MKKYITKTVLNMIKVLIVIALSQFVVNETVSLVNAVILFYVLMNDKNDEVQSK